MVSFIIPLYNCLPLTQACVESLENTLPGGLAYEIIFVDDGSSDGTREWLSAPTGNSKYRVVLNETNLGYARSNNRGAAVARGRWLCLLNNDLLFRKGWLEPMLHEATNLGSHCGLIGNVQRAVRTRKLDHTGILINAKGKPEHRRVWPWSRWLKFAQDVPAVTGACLLLPRSLWQELGGFDEQFVNGCEDVDLCFRARKAGRVNKIMLNSIILHHVSSSAGRKRRDEENTLRLFRRWRDELVELGTPAWCRAYLVENWTSSRDPAEVAFALAAARHALAPGLAPAPEFARRGMEASINREFDRWRSMGLH